MTTPNKASQLKLPATSASLWQFVALIVLVWIVTGGQAYSEWGKKQTSADINLAFFVIMSLGMVLIVRRFSKLNLKRPLFEISSDGIAYQALSKTVPWTSIERIDESGGEKDGTPIVLSLVLRADSDPAILNELSRWNWGVNTRKIHIATKGWPGYSPSTVKQTIYEYMAK